MAVTIPSWLCKAFEAIRRLADHPWTLFAVLLALNAVGRPCSITAHDGRLYSLQALNQAEGGAYADDVFLSYGSQDQFSLFSRAVGPLVAVLGLRLTFILLYLIFNTLFIAALFRLVRALIDDTLISTLALVFLVTAPLTYGSYDIFMVHEQFFTPRTMGTTLTLFALERLVRQRFAASFFLLVAGSLMHPLMAFGGVLIWIGYVVTTWLPWRVAAGLFLGASATGAIVLCIPALATRLFGAMDDDWHQIIRVAAGYNYPDCWPVKDWINVALSFALPIAACFCLDRDNAPRRRFFAIVALAGAVGFLTTFAASLLPYALLFQGQPYRVLWILKVIQIPLGFLFIARWSQSTAIYARAAALALVAYFCVAHYSSQELWIFAIMVTLSLVVSWSRTQATDRLALTPDPTLTPDPSPGGRGENWLWYALARGFVLGAIGWSAYRVWFFASHNETFAQFFDLDEWVMFELIHPCVWVVAVCVTAAWWDTSIEHARLIGWSGAAVALAVPIALFLAEISPAYQREHTRYGNDMAFVRDFIREHRPAATRRPAVYSALGRPDLIWIDVKATNYFDIMQTAGVMFRRETAQEIRRRIHLVNKFEMHRQRQEEIFSSADKKVGMELLLDASFDAPDPTRSDLTRLCREPGLDYIVIPQEFPGLYSASNGRIYVYECDKVRIAAQERPNP